MPRFEIIEIDDPIRVAFGFADGSGVFLSVYDKRLEYDPNATGQVNAVTESIGGLDGGGSYLDLYTGLTGFGQQVDHNTMATFLRRFGVADEQINALPLQLARATGTCWNGDSPPTPPSKRAKRQHEEVVEEKKALAKEQHDQLYQPDLTHTHSKRSLKRIKADEKKRNYIADLEDDHDTKFAFPCNTCKIYRNCGGDKLNVDSLAKSSEHPKLIDDQVGYWKGEVEGISSCAGYTKMKKHHLEQHAFPSFVKFHLKAGGDTAAKKKAKTAEDCGEGEDLRARKKDLMLGFERNGYLSFTQYLSKKNCDRLETLTHQQVSSQWDDWKGHAVPPLYRDMVRDPGKKKAKANPPRATAVISKLERLSPAELEKARVAFEKLAEKPAAKQEEDMDTDDL